jgi:peptidoglycan/LPS O-acetylase OafA/YrhL
MQQATTGQPSPVSGSRHRYVALDALRGICALMVCLFHFRANGPIATLDLVRGSWLFVDFFFVLSGFVIAANYRDQLTSGGGLRNFAILRFGRIYPLHLFMLLLLIAIELMSLIPAIHGVMRRQPFDEYHSFYAILTNLSLTHAFGLHDRLTWNHPSWTIAVEFWTYLFFGLVAAKAGAQLEKWLGVAMVVSIVVLATLSPYFINASYAWSFFRCLYGFAAGAILWRWWSTSGQQPGATYGGATLVEVAAIVMIIVFVSNVGASPLNLLAPLVFGIALIVFARAGGAISRGLASPPLLLLGTLSYSIYMVHVLVQSRMDDLLKVTGRLFGVRLLTPRVLPTGQTIDVVGATALQGTILTFLMLVLVVILSWYTHKYVEVPGQKLARRKTQSRHGPTVVADLPSASDSAKSRL